MSPAFSKSSVYALRDNGQSWCEMGKRRWPFTFEWTISVLHRESHRPVCSLRHSECHRIHIIEHKLTNEYVIWLCNEPSKYSKRFIRILVRHFEFAHHRPHSIEATSIQNCVRFVSPEGAKSQFGRKIKNFEDWKRWKWCDEYFWCWIMLFGSSNHCDGHFIIPSRES